MKRSIHFFNNIPQVIEGHVNEVKEILHLTSERKKEIHAYRENICNTCPIRSNNSCDFKKWINPITKEVAFGERKGFVRGCGCRLSAKQKAFNARCPAGFWGGEEYEEKF